MAVDEMSRVEVDRIAENRLPRVCFENNYSKPTIEQQLLPTQGNYE